MPAISVFSYIILGFLLLAALACVYTGLQKHWRRIQHGKVFSSRHAGKETVPPRVNWRAFLARGLLTSRLGNRPVAGFAHGLLFFGALILIFGHAAFVLSFLGIPVYEGWFGYLVMGLGREVAGIMMFMGVVFFLIRRLVPPERLTVGKTRSGFEKMEIFLLLIVLAGYFSEGFRLSLTPLSLTPETGAEFIGKALGAMLAEKLGAEGSLTGFNLFWWIHGLMGTTFIALIAHSPLSHMLLGLANSAFAGKRPGINLPPINFDLEQETNEEDMVFGAARLADLSRKNLLDLSACLWCGRCHEVCPAGQTGKDLSPKKVMLTCAEYMEQGRFDDDSLIEVLGKEAIFNCTTCAACIEVCPVSNNPAETIMEFRRHYVMDRSEMPETMAAANRNLESREHPFAGTGANPGDWRKDLDVPYFEPGKTEYLLWIGCSITYEERAQEIARAMVKILDAAGVSYGILEEARCTGDPAKMMGNEMQFVEIAEANIEAFQEMQIRKVITLCAHCFNSFDRYYPELGANWETIPHSVLIDDLISQGKLTMAQRTHEKITFHDPCYLARHNDIVDETRNLVSAVGQLIEMPRNRKESFCCGAGGGNYWGGQGGTGRISDVRTREAFDTGADKIATSCSFCLLMLTESAAKHTEERKVYDVAELVADRIPAVNVQDP